MALSNYGLKIGKWYKATNFEDENSIWYDYFISEDNNGLKYIALEYDGDSVYICREDWDEFSDNIIDDYELKPVSAKHVISNVLPVRVFNGIFN